MRSHRSSGRPLMTMPSITLMETLQGVQGHNRTKKHQSPRKPQTIQNQNQPTNQLSPRKNVPYKGGISFALWFRHLSFVLQSRFLIFTCLIQNFLFQISVKTLNANDTQRDFRIPFLLISARKLHYFHFYYPMLPTPKSLFVSG